MNIDRLPPQDIETEVSCLASTLLSREALLKVTEILQPEDFYLDKHRIIYESIIDLERKSSKRYFFYSSSTQLMRTVLFSQMVAPRHSRSRPISTERNRKLCTSIHNDHPRTFAEHVLKRQLGCRVVFTVPEFL